MPTTPAPRWPLFAASTLIAAAAAVAPAEVKVTVDRNVAGGATPAFHFRTVPAPGKRNVARAIISVVDGKPDDGGRRAIYLGKARLPESEDDPKDNFFFAEGTDGGRLRIDLEAVVTVRQVNTYSWHPSVRGPQVYTLWAADGTGAGFDPAPKKGTDPAACGWRRVASVDTRGTDAAAAGGGPGGQYGVSIADPNAGSLGRARYLLLDVSRTEADDAFGNTFFSKVDVIADRAATTTAPAG